MTKGRQFNDKFRKALTTVFDVKFLHRFSDSYNVKCKNYTFIQLYNKFGVFG